MRMLHWIREGVGEILVSLRSTLYLLSVVTFVLCVIALGHAFADVGLQAGYFLLALILFYVSILSAIEAKGDETQALLAVYANNLSVEIEELGDLLTAEEDPEDNGTRH